MQVSRNEVSRRPYVTPRVELAQDITVNGKLPFTTETLYGPLGGPSGSGPS